ncbi:MAG: beta-lactamase family protein [Acidobacteria bacterium]|nr:beta-lactamase family protein [Acidobacteriota bacterium]MCB9396254.1 beta-lactamase family protein [Acidobacteriota bacterium]
MLCVPDTYFPPADNAEWATVAPELLGWDTEPIDTLYTYLEAQNTRGFLVLKNGRIVLEHYWGLSLAGQPFDMESYWYWASAGKTLTAMLVGIAQELGYLQLSESSSLYLGPGWTMLTPEQEAQITILHQLTMTSGLDDDVPDPYCTDPECLIYRAEPGSRWAYHNAPYTLLDGVLESATGQAFSPFFNQHLRDPIDMQGFWLYSGFNHVFYSTVRDMARFGLLILNRGLWAGVPILQDESYFQAMTKPSQTINPSYGYLWWLNGQDTFMVPGLQLPFPGPLTPHAPADMIAAMGKNGQLINVVPSQGLVMIRMGDNPDQSLIPLIFQDELWQHLTPIICPMD